MDDSLLLARMIALRTPRDIPTTHLTTLDVGATGQEVTKWDFVETVLSVVVLPLSRHSRLPPLGIVSPFSVIFRTVVIVALQFLPKTLPPPPTIALFPPVKCLVTKWQNGALGNLSSFVSTLRVVTPPTRTDLHPPVTLATGSGRKTCFARVLYPGPKVLLVTTILFL